MGTDLISPQNSFNMLNPSVDKYTISFSSNFFDNEISKKYNDYLFHLNQPIKDIKSHIEESIQLVTIPGYSLQILNVNGMNNSNVNDLGGVGKKPNFITDTTFNSQYPGTAPMNEVLTDTKVTITFRNTLLNWMYIFEIFKNHYRRDRKISDFQIIITLMDSAEIPMMNFVFTDCFTADIPGLEFAFNANFRESKTIDASFAFRALTPYFKIPEFKKETKIIV